MYEIMYNPWATSPEALGCNGYMSQRLPASPMIRTAAPLIPARTATKRPLFGKPKATRPTRRPTRPVSKRPTPKVPRRPTSPAISRREKPAAAAVKRVEPKKPIIPAIIDRLTGGQPIATIETKIPKEDMTQLWLIGGLLGASLITAGAIVAFTK